ncbi:4Fe-4S binding protein [Pseudodesulfovibrio sp.]|uniref:4Fe-4S binding protein n=1 Tax=Pseudodesulfovibrio sp. TaxID=2035812 RepID=UPI00262348FD|nr:4Fe-4S binding protein [Pseudodesulfovibrio sp.]MDD3313094.1 4Fe-4S binding protein [Pseudodesulfovibrio sp.]
MRHAMPTMTILALLLAGAHALRGADHGLAAAFAFLACLVPTRRAWVRPVAAVALLWAAWAWADATVQFLRFRMALDLPWARLAAILAGVMAVNGLALLALGTDAARSFFRKDAAQGAAKAAVCLLTVFGLAMARAKVPFPVLLADRYFPGWGWAEIAILACYAQWVFGRMAEPEGHRAVRPRIWALFSAVFFLQLALGLSGMEDMLMTGRLHLPVPALIAAGPVFRGGGYFMPILFGVTVLLVGPAWCSHLCYIGAWDDAMSRARKASRPDARLRRLGVAGRGAALVLCVGAAWLLRVMGAPMIVAVLAAAVFGLVGVGVMVLVSRRRGVMAHCSAYCPMGLVAGVLGRLSPWRIRVDDGCTGCGACFSRCRYNALDAARVEAGSPALSCTLCGDCLSACAQGRIGYAFPGLRSGAARTLFLILATSLHAVFLGVARI